MLDLAEIARMEEGRLARALTEVAPEARAVGGGTMARGAPGNWINTAAGLGLRGPVPGSELDALVEYYRSAGIEPRIEVAPFVEPAFLDDLARRGFVPRMFETVFYRELDPARPVEPVHRPPPGLRVGAIDLGDEAQVLEYARVSISGFLPPGQPIPGDFLDSALRVARHPRTVSVAAWLEGRMAGGGSVEVAPPVASLFGLSVLPEHRRRGIQQALLAWRLNHAAARGCRIATIGSKPGAVTERNVRRMGFAVAYTKVTLVRPGPGLVPVIA